MILRPKTRQFSMICSSNFHVSLPENIFGTQNADLYSKWRFWDPHWGPAGALNRPLRRHFRPTNRRLSYLAEVVQASWGRPGRDLRPKTPPTSHLHRFWDDLESPGTNFAPHDAPKQPQIAFLSIFDQFVGAFWTDFGPKNNPQDQPFPHGPTTTPNHNPTTPQTISLKPRPGGMRAKRWNQMI